MEFNFDGIPGPTHNYAGLAQGNLAAARNAQLVSNPREAALQGLAKMRALAARGLPQAILPPQERPFLPALRALGFAGDDAAVLAAAARAAPAVLTAVSSAAAMWVANAATVSPSADTADGRVHFTPANLALHFHRALEAPATTRILHAIFADPAHFVVHDPLPAAPQFGDEGAANHTRFADAAARDAGAGSGAAADERTPASGAASPGAEFFVYGRAGFGGGAAPARHPARQTREAGEAIARRHGLDPARTIHAQQAPEAIDAGVFHNDVIAVGTGTTLLCHARAFVDTPRVLADLGRIVGPAFRAVVIGDDELTLGDAVATYLFNSQLIRRPEGGLLLVAPAECAEHAGARALLERLSAPGGPLAEVLTFDLRQSMKNGGGPACLRLRVDLAPAERAAIGARVFVDDALATALERWIVRHYRDRLAVADLADPALCDESRRALDELTQLLRLPAVYDFQRG